MRNTPDKDSGGILRNTWEWLQARMDDRSAMLNFIISEHDALFALRAAIGEKAPTMYYLYEDSAHLIASEPLTPAKPWQAVPENSILTATRGTPPRITKL